MFHRIPCVLMRGGSSKGLYFLASDLPSDALSRDRLLLAAMGSPDVRQIDGLGGGDDQSSKVVLVAPSRQAGIDVEYLFAQVSVSRDVVDTTPNSGNMVAGVAAFAIERGLVEAGDPTTRVRIFNRNTGKVVQAEVQTPAGRVAYRGNFRLDGVPGTGSPITLDFIDPAGTKTGSLLPTGNVLDEVDGIAVSCLDFANPMVLIAAASVGKTGHESKEELDADSALLLRLEQIRRRCARLMGISDAVGRELPKVLLLAPPRHGGNIASRYFALTTCHTAHALTGALCIAAGAHISGSVVARIANLAPQDPTRMVIEHPSGRTETRVRIVHRTAAGLPVIDCARVVTTARPLFTGLAYVRAQPVSELR